MLNPVKKSSFAIFIGLFVFVSTLSAPLAYADFTAKDKAQLEAVFLNNNNASGLSEIISYLYGLFKGTSKVSTITTAPLSSLSASDKAQICSYAKGINKNLKYGMNESQVLSLQRLLNAIAYKDTNYQFVTTSGQGSYGNETTYFGSATQAAVKKLQDNLSVNLGSGIFPGTYDSVTNTKVKSLVCAESNATTGTSNSSLPGSSNSYSGYPISQTSSDSKECTNSAVCQKPGTLGYVYMTPHVLVNRWEKTTNGFKLFVQAENQEGKNCMYGIRKLSGGGFSNTEFFKKEYDVISITETITESSQLVLQCSRQEDYVVNVVVNGDNLEIGSVVSEVPTSNVLSEYTSNPTQTSWGFENAVTSVTANDKSVKAGDEVTISWSRNGVPGTCTFEGKTLSGKTLFTESFTDAVSRGSKKIVLEESARFILYGCVKNAAASVVVEVTDAFEEDSRPVLSVNKSSISRGASVVLSFDKRGYSDCYVKVFGPQTGGEKYIQLDIGMDSYADSPIAETSYTLMCRLSPEGKLSTTYSNGVNVSVR